MIHFDSRNEFHKSPFGAVKTESEVTFRIKAEGNPFAVCLVANGDKISMSRSDYDIFEVVYKTPSDGCVVFYSFELDYGETIVYGNNPSAKGGAGAEGSKIPYQLTVYEEPDVPEWVQNAVCYQIFPDRFFRAGEVLNPKPGSFIYGSWDDKPMYVKNEKGEIVRWDFFGGNLKGIEEKLDYLEGLGINLIYLNPVFSARSNHRYDTADYKTVDPVLGGDEALKSLIDAAHRRGIRIILDGVFNHTGCDSIYFDLYDRYGDGAYHNENSPYRSWFTFTENGYESWWGVGDLPSVNENEKSYTDYIIKSEDSVIRKWLGMGIDGWRLDVADELPDEFLSMFTTECKKINNDAYVVGEVWEDATNKVAYGKLRPYFTKRELDGVMNYPFRDTVVAFIKGEMSGVEASEALMSLCENYPPECMKASLSLLGTHDSERIITAVGSKERVIALARCQFVYTGIPVIYYGDETGVPGGKDPDNRRTYPWGNRDKSMTEEFCSLVTMRNSEKLLTEGRAWFGHFGENVVFIKRFKGSSAFYAFLNRSDEEICIPWGEKLFDYESGEKTTDCVIIPPLTTKFYKTVDF